MKLATCTVHVAISRAHDLHQVHTSAANLSGCGQFGNDLQAHLRFKRMVSCRFCNKHMRLKTRAYGTGNLQCHNFNWGHELHVQN